MQSDRECSGFDLAPEFIKYLQNEVKIFNDELREITKLPSVESLRLRIKKDKRDTEEMLALYASIVACNLHAKAVKAEIRGCNEEAMKLLGHNIQRPKRNYNFTS